MITILTCLGRGGVPWEMHEWSKGVVPLSFPLFQKQCYFEFEFLQHMNVPFIYMHTGMSVC